MLKAILFGHESIKKIVEFQEEIIEKVGKPNMELPVEEVAEGLEKAVREFATDEIYKAIRIYEKQERETRINTINEETLLHFEDSHPEKRKRYPKYYMISQRRSQKNDFL